MLNGLQNLLSFINDNWTAIIIIVGLILAILKKVKDYLSLSTEQKIDVAKEQIREMILKMVSDAEEDYSEWEKAGSIKRSQVIEEIFERFPILSRVTNQEDLIKWIDEIIDEALVTLRQIVEQIGGVPKAVVHFDNTGESDKEDCDDGK